jgi:hypothetical protein
VRGSAGVVGESVQPGEHEVPRRVRRALRLAGITLVLLAIAV